MRLKELNADQLIKRNVFDGMHHPFGIDQLQLYRKMSFERDLLLRFIRWFKYAMYWKKRN
jgi:hypothetical protein